MNRGIKLTADEKPHSPLAHTQPGLKPGLDLARDTLWRPLEKHDHVSTFHECWRELSCASHLVAESLQQIVEDTRAIEACTRAAAVILRQGLGTHAAETEDKDQPRPKNRRPGNAVRHRLLPRFNHWCCRVQVAAPDFAGVVRTTR